MKKRIYQADREQRERVIEVIVRALHNRAEIGFVYLHGSFLSDLPFHDIDLGVYFSGSASPAAQLRQALDLAGELSRSTGYPMDVRPLNQASPPFAYQVIRGRLIYEQEQDLSTEFVEQAIRRYLDIKPFLLTGMKEAFTA